MRKRRKGVAGFFLAPSFLGVSVFMALPFADVVRRSFLDAVGKAFVGMENYKTVWQNGAFRLAAGNMLKFLAIAVPMLFLVSLVLSLLVFQAKRELFKTSLVLPMVIPAAAMVLVWKILLCRDGALNQLLSGITGREWDADWVNGDTAFWVLLLTYLWKNAGYDMLLWLAGLGSIPESLYDAAQVDGAGGWAKLRYITLPCLRGTMGLVGVLSVVNSFRVYREAYLLAGSYPDQKIYMIPHLFGHWFLTLDVQKMCTAAVIIVAAALLAAAAGRGTGRCVKWLRGQERRTK